VVRATIPLVQDPELRMRIGAKAHSYAVEHFDARICANVHARAFELAVANCTAMHRNGHVPSRPGAGSGTMQLSNPNYKKADVAKFWNDNPCGSSLGNGATPGTPEFFDRTEAERYKREPFIAQFAKFQQWRGNRVLEVGCGMGTDLSMFTRYGAETWGVDLTHASAAIAFKRIAHHGAQPRIMVGDSELLPFPSDVFDLVYSWGVIHHTQNTPAAARELLRVARPGGKVVAMIYNRRSLVALQAYLVYGLFRGRPFAPVKDIIAAHLESPGTKAYTVDEARALFSGLQDMRVTPVVTPYDLRIGRNRFIAPWVGTLVPARLGYFLVVEGIKPEGAGSNGSLK
jgi:ubiquinone/menaquinone biosynthesis C-methylase UbiE